MLCKRKKPVRMSNIDADLFTCIIRLRCRTGEDYSFLCLIILQSPAAFSIQGSEIIRQSTLFHYLCLVLCHRNYYSFTSQSVYYLGNMAFVMIIACPRCQQNLLDRGPTLQPEELESILSLDCSHLIHGSCGRHICLSSPLINGVLCPFPGCQKIINMMNTRVITPFCQTQLLQAHIVTQDTLNHSINHKKRKMDHNPTADGDLPDTLSTTLQPLMSSTNSLTSEPPNIPSTSTVPMSMPIEDKLPPWIQRNKETVKNESITEDDVKPVTQPQPSAYPNTIGSHQNTFTHESIPANNVKPVTQPLVSAKPNVIGFYERITTPNTTNSGHGKSTTAKHQITDAASYAETIAKQQTNILFHGTATPPAHLIKNQSTDYPQIPQNKDHQQNESSNGKSNKQPEQQKDDDNDQSKELQQDDKTHKSTLSPSSADHLAATVVKSILAKFMAPFEPTGSSANNLMQGSYEGHLVYFAHEHLLMGDGIVFNALKTSTSGRSIAGDIENSRYYKPEMTILQMTEIVDAMPELPLKLLISVGSYETRQLSFKLSTMVEQYRNLLDKLFRKGVRALIVLPNIIFNEALPIRNSFNGVLMRQASLNLSWDYLYAGGIMNIPGIRPPTVAKDRVFHKPAESRQHARYIKDLTERHGKNVRRRS